MAVLAEGKVALVTGAASGIGQPSALAFAWRGVAVVIADVNTQGCEQTVKLIKCKGDQAAFVACNVTKVAEVRSLIVRAVECYGRLDCTHNNAGRNLATHP